MGVKLTMPVNGTLVLLRESKRAITKATRLFGSHDPRMGIVEQGIVNLDDQCKGREPERAGVC